MKTFIDFGQISKILCRMDVKVNANNINMKYYALRIELITLKPWKSMILQKGAKSVRTSVNIRGRSTIQSDAASLVFTHDHQNVNSV